MEERRVKIKKGKVSQHLLLWTLIAAVWLLVILKMLIGVLFEKNTSLVSAFSVTNPVFSSATVEVTARFPEDYLDSFDKRQMLGKIAKEIGLTIEGEPEVISTKQRQEVSYEKRARAATTNLRILSLAEENGRETEMKHYLYARITLTESAESILLYKERLEEIFAGLKGCDISTTVQLVGEYSGYLTKDRKDAVTERVLSALNARVVYDYREDDLYTVYAYTAALDNYITVENKKINVHLAMSQDEEKYKTILYLATPILPDT